MISSFPHRMVAATFQFAVVLFEHQPPIVAAVVFFAAVVAVVAVSVTVPWQTARLIVRVWRWIRHRAANRRALAELNREYAALCATYRLDGPADDSDVEHLPGVTRIGPATPPPVRPALRRRRMADMRIPSRILRRNTTNRIKS